LKLSEDELQSDFSDAEDIQEPDDMKQQCAMNKVTNITCKGATNAKESKKIQSHLFEKTPVDTKITQNDLEYNTVATDPAGDECIELRAVTFDSTSQSTNNMPASVFSKESQTTINSWFLAKTKNIK